MAIIFHPQLNRKGLIFIKIPRTAGGFVKKVLYHAAEKTRDLKQEPENRLSSSGYYGRTGLRRRLQYPLDNYQLCTVIRNPYDRFISSLAYYSNGLGKSFEDDFLHNSKLGISSIRNLKNAIVKKNPAQFKHYQKHIFIEQSKFLGGLKNKNIRVLSFENINEEVIDFINEINLDASDLVGGLKDKSVNKFGYSKDRKHFTEYYTAETKQYVETLFPNDFNLLPYDMKWKADNE